jgi:hypothetical protein
MAPMQARDQGGNAERTCSEVRSGATAGRGGRGVIVYAGGEGAEKVGDGHCSTRSALQRRESLPFAAWRLQWGVERKEGVDCGGRERPVWW